MKKQKIISIILIIFVLITLIYIIKPVQATKEIKENETIIIYDDGTKEETQPQYHLYKQIHRQNHIESYFDIIIGVVLGITLYIGIRSVLSKNKKLGVIELILTFLAPTFTFLWCKWCLGSGFLENSFEILLKTIFCNNAYQMFFSNLVLITYIFLIILTVYNILQIRKVKGENRK